MITATRRIGWRDCACAANGHATAVPHKAATTSRRRTFVIPRPIASLWRRLIQQILWDLVDTNRTGCVLVDDQLEIRPVCRAFNFAAIEKLSNTLCGTLIELQRLRSIRHQTTAFRIHSIRVNRRQLVVNRKPGNELTASCRQSRPGHDQTTFAWPGICEIFDLPFDLSS